MARNKNLARVELQMDKQMKAELEAIKEAKGLLNLTDVIRLACKDLIIKENKTELDNIIEMLEETGKIPVSTIKDFAKTVNDLESKGYEVELDASTDWLVLI